MTTNERATISSIRILHVEDNQRDSDLVQAMLASEGFDCEIRRVETPEAFASALDQGGFDLILSDYTLPSYDGHAALLLAQAKRPDVPFIFFSGTLGEERAVAALKDGATDYVLKSSPARFVAAVVRALHDADGIAARKRAEAALRESEARFRAVAETATDAIVSADQRGHIIYFNPGAERIFGYAAREVLGRPLTLLMPTRFHEAHRQGLARFLTTGEAHVVGRTVELVGQRKEGTEFPLELSLASWKASGDTFFTGILRDITERKQTEEARRQAEERFRGIYESSRDAIGYATLDSRLLDVNEAFASLTGYAREELLTKTIFDLTPPEYQTITAESTDRTIRTGEPTEYEKECLRKDGSRVPAAVTIFVVKGSDGRPVGLAAIIKDIAERKRLEEQFRQAQKMEAIGQLSSGIAHDFNNLLTVINGYSELLLSRSGPTDSMRKELALIKTAGQRAAALTQQLLAFSRKQILQPQILDLHEVVASTDKLLRRLIGENITLISLPVQGLGRVKADRGQIEQIIMNLAVNARDAMPQGGRLTIEVANVELDQAYARRHVSVQPGPYVLLAVSDTGIGMDANTQARLFEPFFTTKEPGKGTGLGLATVYGIVKQSGGNIWVYSEPGKGTTFKVYLPRVEEAAEATAPVSVRPETLRGSETILLVEDEEMVRTLARAVLQYHDYTVLEAKTGQEALRLCQEHRGPIHLLVTDMVMPGMSGRDSAARLAALRPDLKILYMSGYTEHAIVDGGALDVGTTFLQKPFTPAALVQKVREVLDASR